MNGEVAEGGVPAWRRRPPPDDFDLVSTGDIAQLLNVRPATVRQWAHRGYLPVPVGYVRGGPYGIHGQPVAMRIWRWGTVRVWAQRCGRLDDQGRPQRASSSPRARRR
jgi:hypothetical protein